MWEFHDEDDGVKRCYITSSRNNGGLVKTKVKSYNVCAVSRRIPRHLNSQQHQFSPVPLPLPLPLTMSDVSSNPLLAFTEDISKSQSIAFCAVYGLFVILIAIRLLARVKSTFAYVFILVFAISECNDPQSLESSRQY